MIVIGSSAIKYHFPDFPRKPKDLDIAIINESWKGESILNGKKVEYLVNPILYDHLYLNSYLSPDMLYTLKISHIFWDINWEKHMWDINWLKNKGCKLIKDEFYKLYEYWNNYHAKNKRSNLKMSSSDFFDNALKCSYSHDWLHTLINPNPTFNKVLKDGEEVEVDENKFNKLTFDEKCNLVREEVEVMAWERWPKINYKPAYSRMLKKFIINHAPIWEALFIVENYVLLLKPRNNFFKIIEDGIKKNK